MRHYQEHGSDNPIRNQLNDTFNEDPKGEFVDMNMLFKGPRLAVAERDGDLSDGLRKRGEKITTKVIQARYNAYTQSNTSQDTLSSRQKRDFNTQWDTSPDILSRAVKRYLNTEWDTSQDNSSSGLKRYLNTQLDTSQATLFSGQKKFLSIIQPNRTGPMRLAHMKERINSRPEYLTSNISQDTLSSGYEGYLNYYQ